MSPIFRICLAVLVALWAGALHVHGQSDVYKRVAVPGDASTLERLRAAGIGLDHFHVEGNDVVLELSMDEISALEAKGVQSHILVEDLASWYAARLQSTPGPVLGEGPQPAGFHLGSMGGYLTYAEAIAELDSMRTNFPDLISIRDSIGRTYEGRGIWVVRISDNPDFDEEEPEVFYNALHHAREPISLMQLIYFMHYLLENYGQDSLVTYLIKEREMYFVPVVNPDGYVFNEQINPGGGGMWRKNRRLLQTGDYGVDLNRNYGFGWGVDNWGSSPDPASNSYRGLYPFSETETEAIRDLCIERNFATGLSFHGYGEYLLYPWGYDPSMTIPDMERFQDFATLLTKDHHYYPGNPMETVGYPANGVSDDWMYGEQAFKPKMFTFSPELGNAMDAFWPATNRIVPICDAQVSQNLRIAWLAGPCVGMEPMVPPAMEGTELHLPIRYTNHGLIATGVGFTTEFSSNDPHIIGIPNPLHTIPALGSAAQRTELFTIMVQSGLPKGTPIEGIVKTFLPGGVVLQDSIWFRYGIPDTLLVDRVEMGPSYWTGGWSMTPERASSQGFSYTDSPWSVYANNSQNQCDLIVPVDFTNHTYPYLTFKSWWDVDHAYDYVQVLGSEDGITYTPLEGRHCIEGQGIQPAGQPIYEGRSYIWREERVDLSAYAGKHLYLRFELVSDTWRTRDGFYFDDLILTAYGTGVGTDAGNAPPQGFLHPNPANAQVRVAGAGGTLTITTLTGKPVFQQPVEQGALLPTVLIPRGIYLYRIQSEGEAQPWRKLVLQ